MLNSFVQEIHNLVGAPEDIEALAKKDHARILICSDSHGHPEVLEKIIENFGSTCDGFAFCGDGAGDVAAVIRRAKIDAEFAKLVPAVIAFVRGNGDPSSYPLSDDFSLKIPESQILNVNGRNLMFVHGHRQGVDFGLENYGLEMQVNECCVGFYGHTHIAYEETIEKYKFVNPGSCARPRGGQPPSFAIATVEKHFVDIAFLKMNIGIPNAKPFQLWSPIL